MAGFDKLRPQSEADIYRKRYPKKGRIESFLEDLRETARHKRMIKKMPRWRLRREYEEEDI